MELALFLAAVVAVAILGWLLDTGDGEGVTDDDRPTLDVQNHRGDD